MLTRAEAIELYYESFGVKLFDKECMNRIEEIIRQSAKNGNVMATITSELEISPVILNLLRERGFEVNNDYCFGKAMLTIFWS